MAVLSDADRMALWAKLMSDASAGRVPLALSKVDLRAAIDAADTWADANALAFNLALPLVVRGALTAKQKAQLLSYVILKRFEVS
jgi:hypothetical protein